MKLIRFGEVGREKPGVLLDDGSRLEVSAFGSDYDEEFFASNGVDKLQQWPKMNSARAPRVSGNMRLGRPSEVVCIGLNYRDHAAETGAEIRPYDPLVIPQNATKVDWVVELAVAIGKRALYVAKENALDHVAEYALHNDNSERSF
jgi:2,4-diketo-3-deoxy-L-fuconate hydrolase